MRRVCRICKDPLPLGETGRLCAGCADRIHDERRDEPRDEPPEEFGL